MKPLKLIVLEEGLLGMHSEDAQRQFDNWLEKLKITMQSYSAGMILLDEEEFLELFEVRPHPPVKAAKE